MYAVSVLVCKRQRYVNAYIFAANWNIAVGMLFSESMCEPRGFHAYFCGCNIKDELHLVAQRPPHPGPLRADVCRLSARIVLG